MYIFLSFIFGASISFLSEYFVVTSLLITSFLLLYLLLNCLRREKKFPKVALILIFACLGFFYSKHSSIPTLSIPQITEKPLRIEGFLRSQKQIMTKRGERFLQSIEVVSAQNNDGEKLPLKEVKAINQYPLKTDKHYILSCYIPKSEYYLNPGSHNKFATVYILSFMEADELEKGVFENLRQKLNTFIKKTFSEESAAFLMSISTGERIFISRELNNAFNLTGLAHLLSISGSHFGLLFAILFWGFKSFLLRLPYKFLCRLTLFVTPSQVAAILSSPFLLFYLFLSNMSIPTLRSFIMIILFVIGLLIGRKGVWLNTIAIAAFFILIIEPTALLELSFILSFIAVLSIGIMTELISKEQQKEITFQKEENQILKPLRIIAEKIKFSFAISFAATIGTAPIVAYFFNYYCVISPITNLVITPFVGFVILPLTLISSITYLTFDIFPFATLLDNLTLTTLNIIKDVSNWGFVDIKIPAFPAILLITFYSGIALYLFIRDSLSKEKRHKFYQLSFAISLFPLIFYFCYKIFTASGLSITFLDVGQGDAAVVELPDKKIMVIDTGRSGYELSEFLRYRGIKEVDFLVISHTQSDHAGGLEYLIQKFKVKTLWISRFSYNPQIFESLPYRILSRGDEITSKGYTISILHPYDDFYTYSGKDDENNYSLVLKIKGINNSFLFTGDIEFEAQEDLSSLKEHLKSNVLKVPHHGSKSSANETFFHMVSPQYSIISVGRNSPHGHPHKETLSLMTNSIIVRTDLEGAIKVSESQQGELTLKTFRQFAFRKYIKIEDELHNLNRLLTTW
ncbi:MAG: DNA internalization-related competence protein ComEC/Rec2 [Thermodesulfovibrionales bacterium]|nr:DNA internalization-related competence protein ComEC/Rec2 [Thermodesulfovibrionales bacterium]